MKLTLKTDPELSFFHVVRAVACDETTVDPKLNDAVSESTTKINERLHLAELSVGDFWDTLFAHGGARDAQRIEFALLAAGCSELSVDALCSLIQGRLVDARLALREQFPKFAEQLPLRARPITELWDATGIGILREIGRTTISKLIPGRTTMHLVQPARGGNGGLLEKPDAIWMEALLAHVDPTIPETLRIAWLVTLRGWRKIQASSGTSPSDTIRSTGTVAALALIPITLRAGQALDLCTCDQASIASAAQLWVPDTRSDVLNTWWQQMQEQELPLPVAIRALEKMLS